ncbi:hypothetical protein LTR85_009720 [Meristemomyces frigidus]|nr:hypothetical protein LTR85_009720 [Meristemomyces frigidus]
MSSTGDELSEAESRPQSSLGGVDGAQRSIPPPSAQLARDIPSSPPAQAGASRHEASESQNEEDGDDSDRENRFDGPASTWRSHTQDERQLIASLDQQRANDLSVHLYNAHALKARLYDREAISTAKSWSSKRRWIKPDEDGDVPWQPNRNWTAWPLPVDEVPRTEEVFGVPPAALRDQQGTYRKSEPWMPSADLQEEVQSLMLRKAKERFRQRRWATARDSADVDLGKAPGAGNNAARSSIEDVSDQGDSDGDLQDRKPTIASKPEHAQPAFLADDDRANAILQPSIRHIIAKFDDLLIGLHKSRQGQRRPVSASRSRSRASATRSRSRSAAPVKTPRSRGRSNGKRKAAVTDDEGSNYSPDDESAASSQVGASPTRARKKSRPSRASGHELGLRDWSEVLGIASLVGWDQAVVDRAARRCAALFGEEMSIRSMPETSVDHTGDRTVRYVPDMVPAESETESEVSEAADEVASETTDATIWFCPYERCGRHHKAFEKGWRWREHLRRTHKLSVEQVEEVELARRPGKGNHDKSDASGPDAEEQAGDEDEGSAHRDQGEEMVGGVHRDGFLQLLTGKLERGRDAKPRRRRSTNERKGSKRRRLETDEAIDSIP